jgi:hypothetical protein
MRVGGDAGEDTRHYIRQIILPDEAKFFLPPYVPHLRNYGAASWQADNTHLPWTAKFSY